MKDKKCKHENTTTLKSYRVNYSHGSKSKNVKYGKPRRCTLYCDECKKKLFRWKPHQGQNKVK